MTILRLITTVWPEMSQNSYLHHFSAQVSQIVFFAYLTVLRLYYNCHDLKCQKTHIWNVKKPLPPFQCTSITNRVLSLFDHFTAYYNCMTWNVRKLISPQFQFSAQVSQIVFFAYLTILRFITTVWPEMSENSLLRTFSAQVSQIVFLAYLTFYGLLQLYDLKYQKIHISTISVHKYHKSCSSFIWPFYGLLQLYDLKCQKSHISATSVHKYQMLFSKLIWPFYG